MLDTIESDKAVALLSRASGPTVHRYYDVPAESPDGTHLLYSEFESASIPGPARVVIADRDGGQPRVVGVCSHAIGHVGANPCWLDDETLALCPDGPGGGVTQVCSIDGHVQRTLDGQIRSVHEGRRKGILINDGGGMGGRDEMSLYKRMQSIAMWDFDTNEQHVLLTVQQAAKVHPLRDQFEAEQTSLQNCKWSTDGSQLLVVFTDSRYQHPRGNPPTILSIMVLNADPSNPDPRYLGEFNDHPMWAPRGQFIIAHDLWEGEKSIVAYPVDGSPRYALLKGVRSVHPSLNREETHLLTDSFVNEDGKARILQYELATGDVQTLATGVHADTNHQTGSHPHPQYSRDESCVLFNHACSGRPQVYAVAL